MSHCTNCGLPMDDCEARQYTLCRRCIRLLNKPESGRVRTIYDYGVDLLGRKPVRLIPDLFDEVEDEED